MLNDSLQFSSVPQPCATFCDPMNCSTPGLSVHHQLPELTQTHVHQLVMPSSHLILCHPLLLLPPILLASGSFLMSQFFSSGDQSIGVSVSASVLPTNTQDWFPLGLSGLISLLSKGLSRVFSNTTVQKHQFFSTQLSFKTVSPSVNLCHQEASISPLSFSIRGQTDWKPQSQKTNRSYHMDHSLV